jgi:hypothetical protein
MAFREMHILQPGEVINTNEYLLVVDRVEGNTAWLWAFSYDSSRAAQEHRPVVVITLSACQQPWQEGEIYPNLGAYLAEYGRQIGRTIAFNKRSA